MENERNKLGAFKKNCVCFYFLSNFLRDGGMKWLTSKCLGCSGTSVSPQPDMRTFSRASKSNHQCPSFLTNDQTERSPSFLSRRTPEATGRRPGRPAASLQQNCPSPLVALF